MTGAAFEIIPLMTPRHSSRLRCWIFTRLRSWHKVQDASRTRRRPLSVATGCEEPVSAAVTAKANRRVAPANAGEMALHGWLVSRNFEIALHRSLRPGAGDGAVIGIADIVELAVGAHVYAGL